MTTQVASEYSDRKTGLVLFGVLEVAIGCVCALAMLAVLLGLAVSKGSSGPAPSPYAFAPAIAMYGVFAVAFIWLGIGSINARRWARAILLCGSAVALIGGIFSCASMSFVLPHMFDVMTQQGQPTLQPTVLRIVKIFTAVFMLIVYIVIPGALFLFYRSPHVKRTCEVRDPVERWTDRCPLPVLALSLPMGIGGFGVLCVMAWFHVVPVFGVFLAGGAGLLATGLIGGLLLYLARGFYRLQVQAWWIALGMLVLGEISALVTFLRADLGEMYLKMGLDQRAAAMSGQLVAQPAFKWMTLLSILPWLLWLLCIRHYFYGVVIARVSKQREHL